MKATNTAAISAGPPQVHGLGTTGQGLCTCTHVRPPAPQRRRLCFAKEVEVLSPKQVRADDKVQNCSLSGATTEGPFTLLCRWPKKKLEVSDIALTKLTVIKP